jgi:hypothetical protein
VTVKVLLLGGTLCRPVEVHGHVDVSEVSTSSILRIEKYAKKATARGKLQAELCLLLVPSWFIVRRTFRSR